MAGLSVAVVPSDPRAGGKATSTTGAATGFGGATGGVPGGMGLGRVQVHNRERAERCRDTVPTLFERCFRAPTSRRKRAENVAESAPLIPAFSHGTATGNASPPAFGRKYGNSLALGRFDLVETG